MADRLVRAGVSREQAGDASRALVKPGLPLESAVAARIQRARPALRVAGDEQLHRRRAWSSCVSPWVWGSAGPTTPDQPMPRARNLGYGPETRRGRLAHRRRDLAESGTPSEQLDDEELQAARALLSRATIDEWMAPGSGRRAFRRPQPRAPAGARFLAGHASGRAPGDGPRLGDELEPPARAGGGAGERAVAAGDEQAGVADTGTWSTGVEGAGRQPATRPNDAGRVDRDPDLIHTTRISGLRCSHGRSSRPTKATRTLTRRLVARGMTDLRPHRPDRESSKPSTGPSSVSSSCRWIAPVEAVEQLMPVHAQLQEMGVKEPGAPEPQPSPRSAPPSDRGSTEQAECLRAEQHVLTR